MHGRTLPWVRYFRRLDLPVADNCQYTTLREFIAMWCVWKDRSNVADESFAGALQLAGSMLR